MAVESSAGSSGRKVCWNTKCGATSSPTWRPGWSVRSGRTAELCDQCGVVYQQSRYCETFHRDDGGWRTCNSCKKNVHCGCVASVHEVVLLDKGGVECIRCAQAHDTSGAVPLVGKHGQQLLAPAGMDNGKVVDPAGRGWCEGYGAALVACQSDTGQWQPSSAGRVPMSSPSGLPGTWQSPQGSEQPVKNRDAGEHSVYEAPDCVVEGVDMERSAALDRIKLSGMGASGGGSPQSGGHMENAPQSPGKSGAETSPGINLSRGSSPLGFDGGPRGGPEVTAGEAGEGKSGGQHRPPRIRQLLPRPHGSSGAPPPFEPAFDPQAPLRVARPPGEGRGRNQLLPRYWPRITDQELKQITSGDMHTVITPLFEKMLSASDAGRIGRLVLPKACAEAYFPPIHQPEGLPLRIQDVTGRDWVFQFRFWPNNNSRMYVLEGVTPCIQSMRLHAGDTVTFSRLEADGKLVMGYRRAPSSLSSQDAGASRAAATVNIGLPTASSVANQSADTWGSNVGVSKSKDNSIIGQLWSSQMDRKRGRPLGSKSKRLRLDSADALILKSNWEEVQELLRPSPSAIPTTITIDGHEFEEYSEPPVFAKRTFMTSSPSGEQEQWAQCDDCGIWRRLPNDAFVPAKWSCSQNTWDPMRAQCSAPQEVSTDKLEVLLGHVQNQEGGKQECAPKTLVNPREEKVPTTSAAAGLDTLAQAASTTLSPVRTTKHPRHRPGCSCIVCIQPPSGKGPKHKASCICNVCVTVKRRFRTLMQRRKKRQFERESEMARNKREWPRDDVPELLALDATARPEIVGGIKSVEPSTPLVHSRDGGLEEGPTKAPIDLNIQPEHEERISMVRLLENATLPLDAYLHQQRLVSLYFGEPASDQVSNDGSSSHEEEVVSESSSKALADSGVEVPGPARFEPQHVQSPYGYGEQPGHLENWDLRIVKPAEFSGDSVHSSSSKKDYSMLNNVVASTTSAKKYSTGAGRGRQICVGCGEPIGSAAKVCRRCGTCTAFGKKKRGVPL